MVIVKQTYYYFAGMVLAALLLSCQKNKCFHATGNITTQVREISPFTEIQAEKNINVVLTPDSAAYLTVEAGENTLDFIETTVQNGILYLQNNSKCNYLRSFKKTITITVPAASLQKISHSGSGNITTSSVLNIPVFKMDITDGSGSYRLQLNSDSIYLWQHTGPADFTLSGNTNFLYTYTSGNGWFYLDKLQAGNVHINHNGTGDIQVWAMQTLLIELQNMGNIQYKGNPQITITNHSGSGSINPLP